MRGDRWDGGDLMERDQSSLLRPFTRHLQTPPLLLGNRRGFGTQENQDAVVDGDRVGPCATVGFDCFRLSTEVRGAGARVSAPHKSVKETVKNNQHSVP